MTGLPVLPMPKPVALWIEPPPTIAPFLIAGTLTAYYFRFVTDFLFVDDDSRRNLQYFPGYKLIEPPLGDALYEVAPL